jgi:hypothetical protein
VYLKLNIERTEKFMLASFLLLKIYLLYIKIGQPIGFDAKPYIRVFRDTHWFQALPSIREYVYAYHPPLAPLIQRFISAFGFDPIYSSQIFSFICIIGSFFAFRAILKKIGLLDKFCGVAFLYLAFSLPVFIFMTYEIGNDAPVFLFANIVLYLSVFLFWDKKIKKDRNNIDRLVMIFLMLVISASMLVKYTGFLNIFIPFFVILVRGTKKDLIRNIVLAVLIAILSISLVFPFYYYRYYKSEKSFFPVNADWIIESRGIAEEVEKRREKKLLYIAKNMIRIPRESFYLANEPVRDSFFHSIWFQTWKLDKRAEEQGKASSIFSNIYLTIFFALMLLGTVSFGLFFGGRDPTWNSLGGLLVCVGLLFAFGMIFYGFKYPLWSWIIFKSKYMAPSLLWISYSTVTFLMDIPSIFTKLKMRHIEHVSLICIFVFMVINHVLPVY